MKVPDIHRIECVQLSEIKEKDFIALMNNEAVIKHLPLLTDTFSKGKYFSFLAQKKKMWDEHGYGPWAFIIKSEFAGWGGLQPEGSDADFALVLHPKFWGYGKAIFSIVKHQAFSEMKLDSITALLPVSRLNSGALKRLGFVEDGEIELDEKAFIRFRLSRY